MTGDKMAALYVIRNMKPFSELCGDVTICGDILKQSTLSKPEKSFTQTSRVKLYNTWSSILILFKLRLLQSSMCCFFTFKSDVFIVKIKLNNNLTTMD